MINKKLALIIIAGLMTCAVASGESPEKRIKITINNNAFDLELESNSATEELAKKLEKGNITINAKDYGNFEKVGDLGFSLPRNDEKVNANSGDIVLYQGNQISLLYDSHSWTYTRIGKIKDIDTDHLKEVLGNENATLVLSME